MRTRSTWIWLLTGAAILGFGSGCTEHRHESTAAGLTPCPDSPNCVSSLATDPGHKVEPIAYQGSPAEARRMLLEVIRAMPRTRVRPDEGGILHVEFTSALFRFVDDVELLIEEARPLIQVRSASRVGYWDMGANRRRVDEIRRKMSQVSPKGGFMSTDFTSLDRPEVLMFLFHPRREDRGTHRRTLAETGGAPGVADALVPVEEGIVVGARFHLADRGHPTVLFFHGNGEIAADYDDIGPLYNRMGLNFIAADYRGYGRSNGRPTVAAMMRDSRAVFRFVREWLAAHRFNGPLIVMGRSLGSASALEIADAHPAEISGLIIESGFAWAAPLLRLLGVDPVSVGFTEGRGFQHLAKIARCDKPTLVIHAQFDRIIPFSDGQALFDASPAPHKRLLQIPGAGHNDLLLHGLEDYLTAIRNLADTIAARQAD